MFDMEDTLFFLDYYMSESSEGFASPAPFALSEPDPAGVFPDRVYSKEELLAYLEHGRKKCKARIDNLTDETASQRCGFSHPEITVAELLLYKMRHIQHHAAQLNLILRKKLAPHTAGLPERKTDTTAISSLITLDHYVHYVGTLSLAVFRESLIDPALLTP